jgi:hypothetical protein
VKSWIRRGGEELKRQRRNEEDNNVKGIGRNGSSSKRKNKIAPRFPWGLFVAVQWSKGELPGKCLSNKEHARCVRKETSLNVPNNSAASHCA